MFAMFADDKLKNIGYSKKFRRSKNVTLKYFKNYFVAGLTNI